MTQHVLGAWPEWRDRLIFALRMENVSGSEIGVILAEAESHLDATGEQPEDAFGDPAEYARQRGHDSPRVSKIGPALPTSSRWPLGALEGTSLLELGLVLACMAGSILIGSSTWAIGAEQGQVGNLPAWAALAIGVVLAGGPLLFLPDERIVDPRSGAVAKIGGPTIRGWPLLVWVVPLLLTVGLGWFSNS